MIRMPTLGRDLHRHPGVRFIAVGAFNTLFGYAIYLAGLGLGLRPEYSLAVATAIGALFNYFTTARFVFGHRALDRLPVFIAAYAAIYVVNALAIQVLLRAGLPPAGAQGLLVPVMAALSFLIFRTFVFSPVAPR
ncbi:MAG: GtrA family protein [Janthinobacterium lividum]